MIRELKETAHTVRMSCETSCSGLNMPCFKDRMTYEKRGEDLEVGRKLKMKEALAMRKST